MPKNQRLRLPSPIMHRVNMAAPGEKPPLIENMSMMHLFTMYECTYIVDVFPMMHLLTIY